MKFGAVLCLVIPLLINSILNAAPCENEKTLIERYDFFSRDGDVLTVTFEDGSRKEYKTNTNTESWSEFQYYCLHAYYPQYGSFVLYYNPYESPTYRWINRSSKRETEVGPAMIFSPDKQRVLSINNGGCEMDGAVTVFGIWNLAGGVLDQEFRESYKDEKLCAWTASWIDDNTIDVEFYTYVRPNYVFPHKKLAREGSKWIWDDSQQESAAED